MNLDEFILPLKKWWWLLALASIAAGITSYSVAKMQPPVYQVRTTLMVGKTIENPNPTSGDFYLEQSLANVYADMARREPVRNATMKALGLVWLPSYVVQVAPNSQLVEIQVTDTNPERTMLVAAELRALPAVKAGSIGANFIGERDAGFGIAWNGVPNSEPCHKAQEYSPNAPTIRSARSLPR